jgi:hypothetical protein
MACGFAMTTAPVSTANPKDARRPQLLAVFFFFAELV